MIKAFLFDYDGVITKGVDVNIPAERLAKNADVSIDEATNAIKNIWDGYSTGALSKDEIWVSVENELGKEVEQDKRDIWFGWEELMPIDSMLELVGNIKSAGFPVGLVSNVFQETADVIRLNGGYSNFDFTILSCEVGAREPDRLIYQSAMEHLSGIHANEVMFLDDRQRCIDGANEFGLNTILVANREEAIMKVSRLIGLK